MRSSVSFFASPWYAPLAFAGLVAGTPIGCVLPKQGQSQQPSAAVLSAADALFAPPAPQGVVSPPTRVVDIAFTVMNADFDSADSGDGRKIWNHVDEMRIDARQAQLLARNGLRVGAASPATWPAIQTLLDAGKARISANQLFPQRGAPMAIAAGSLEVGTSIFTYQAGGQLVGKSFQGGEKVILIDYALRPELDGCTDLGLGFEISRESGDMVWEQREGVIVQVPEHERHRFADLNTLLTLNPGEFLVIGPRDDVKNPHLVGTQFFSKKSGDGSVRLMFIAPRPYQVQSSLRSTP